MRNFALLTKKDIEDLKIFKNSCLGVLVASVVSIVIIYWIYTGYARDLGVFNYIILFILGFLYRDIFNRYVHNYKLFRSIMGKTKVKSDK